MTKLAENQPFCQWGASAAYALQQPMEDGIDPTLGGRLTAIAQLQHPISGRCKNGHAMRAVRRIGVITPVFHHGGVEIQLLTLMRYLDHRRYEFSGIAVTESMETEIAQLAATHTRLGTGPLAIDGICSNSDALIVWATPNVASVIPDSYRGPVIHVIHGSSEWSRRMAVQAGSRVTHYVAVSETARRAMPPEIAARAVVIRNGVDVARIRPTDSRWRLAEEWRLPMDRYVIGYVGRYSEEKDYLSAARAAQELGAHALYVGRVCGIADAEQRIRSASSRVTLLPSDSNIGDALACMDVLVCTSPEEGFGLSVVEAWLSRTPTVTCHTGIAADLDRQDYYCQFVPPHSDGYEVSRACERAILAHRAGCFASTYNYAYGHLTAPTMARSWEEFLDAVLD